MMKRMSKAYVTPVTRQRAWLKRSVVDIPLANRYGGGSKVWKCASGNRQLTQKFMESENYPLGVSVSISALT